MTPSPSLHPNLFYREITLTQGQIALCDAEDYEHLMLYKWHSCWSDITKSYYALRTFVGPHGKRTSMSMHREVMRMGFGDPRRVDHRDPWATTDNRKENLRVATRGQNTMNSRRPKSPSGHRCVYFHSQSRKWRVQVTANGVAHYFGGYTDPDEAGEVARREIKRLHGEFARLA